MKAKKAKAKQLSDRTVRARAKGKWIYMDLRADDPGDKCRSLIDLMARDAPSALPCVAALMSIETSWKIMHAPQGEYRYYRRGFIIDQLYGQRMLIIWSAAAKSASVRQPTTKELKSVHTMLEAGWRIVEKYRPRYSDDTCLSVLLENGEARYLFTVDDDWNRSAIPLADFNDPNVVSFAEHKARRDAQD